MQHQVIFGKEPARLPRGGESRRSRVHQLPPTGRTSFQTEGRGYVIEWEKDLFGWTVVRRRWFGLKSRRGGWKENVFPSAELAEVFIHQIGLRRRSHGYTAIANQLPDDLRDLAARASRVVRRPVSDSWADDPAQDNTAQPEPLHHSKRMRA